MAVILAFGSAAVFALGTVLQQRVVMDAPEAREASAGILFRLIHHPVWLGGIAAYGIAFGMQAAALGDGRLVVGPADPGDDDRLRAARRRLGACSSAWSRR